MSKTFAWHCQLSLNVSRRSCRFRVCIVVTVLADSRCLHELCVGKQPFREAAAVPGIVVAITDHGMILKSSTIHQFWLPAEHC